MTINISKSIGKPFLKSDNPTIVKWIICIRYRNNAGEAKEYKRTYDLNKAPFVLKGVVAKGDKIYQARKKRAEMYINYLIDKLDNTEFDVEAGDFVADKLEIPVKHYLRDWLKWKTNKVSKSSLRQYELKCNVIITVCLLELR